MNLPKTPLLQTNSLLLLLIITRLVNTGGGVGPPSRKILRQSKSQACLEKALSDIAFPKRLESSDHHIYLLMSNCHSFLSMLYVIKFSVWPHIFRLLHFFLMFWLMFQVQLRYNFSFHERIKFFRLSQWKIFETFAKLKLWLKINMNHESENAAVL